MLSFQIHTSVFRYNNSAQNFWSSQAHPETLAWTLESLRLSTVVHNDGGLWRTANNPLAQCKSSSRKAMGSFHITQEKRGYKWLQPRLFSGHTNSGRNMMTQVCSLSQAYLGVGKNFLVIRATVMDDIHMQAHTLKLLVPNQNSTIFHPLEYLFSSFIWITVNNFFSFPLSHSQMQSP